jgi:glycosyltransferase involved in cell wall biosynthesis
MPAIRPIGRTGQRHCLHISQKDLSRRNAETTHVLELARALVEIGWRVRVVAPAVGKSEVSVPFRIDYLPALNSPRLLRLLTYEVSLLLYLCTRPEVWLRRVSFYVRKGTILLSPMVLARMLGIPIILEVNALDTEIELHTKLHPAVLAVLQKLSRLSFRLATRIVVPVETVKDALLAEGVPAAKVSAIANGVNEAMFHRIEGDVARKILGLDDGICICYTGHMGSWQGLDTLLAAVAEAGAPVRVLLVGDGPLRPAFERQARHLGIGRRAIFKGPVPLGELPVYVSAADICVVPATVATHSPVKLFEYLACERPVIGSNVPGIREVVGRYECGWLAEPGDVHDWADKIRAAVSASPEQRRAMGIKGRDAVLKHYTWKAAARRVEPMLNRVV